MRVAHGISWSIPPPTLLANINTPKARQGKVRVATVYRCGATIVIPYRSLQKKKRRDIYQVFITSRANLTYWYGRVSEGVLLNPSHQVVSRIWGRSCSAYIVGSINTRDWGMIKQPPHTHVSCQNHPGMRVAHGISWSITPPTLLANAMINTPKARSGKVRVATVHRCGATIVIPYRSLQKKREETSIRYS